MSQFIVDASQGIVTLKLAPEDRGHLEQLQALLKVEQNASASREQVVVLSEASVFRGDRLLSPRVAELEVGVTVRLQRSAWKEFPLSSFGDEQRKNAKQDSPRALQQLWSEWQRTHDTEDIGAGPKACFLRLCLDLGQLLWQQQCHQWTVLGKAWVHEEKKLGCVKYYLLGQKVGSAPVFDGICARCGQLLYGQVNRSTGTTGNKFTGAPCKKDDKTLCSEHAQPPFLLRWPPYYFPEALPDVFELGEDNKLSLQEQHRLQPPWKAVPHHRRKDSSQAWLYGSTCHKHIFNASAQKDQPPLPFRDEASLQKLRGLPEARSSVESRPADLEAKTFLKECKTARSRAARPNPQHGGRMSNNNLVPEPDPSLWQVTFFLLCTPLKNMGFRREL